MQQRGFYDRVHKGYLTLAKNFPERYVVIDATDLLNRSRLQFGMLLEKRLPAAMKKPKIKNQGNQPCRQAGLR